MKRIISAIWILLLTAIPAFATVNIETTRVAYTCNGVITSYAYPFKVLADGDLTVVKKATATSAETTLTLNTDYSVTGAGSSAGTVVLTAGSKCGTGYTLTILRNMAATQGTDYVDGEAFSAESIENALDRVTLIQQQQREEIGRAPKLPKTSTITDIALPNPTANNYIGWNAGATGLANLTGPVTTTATQYEVDALISYGGGTSYTQATIEAALSAIGTTNKVTLLLRPGAWAISSPLAFPANVDVDMPAGAYFTFSGTGAVTGIKETTPEMFGAKLDGTTDDAAAIVKAFANGGKITFRSIGLVSTQIPVTVANTEVIGNNIGGLKLKANSSVDAGSNWPWIYVTANDVAFKGVVIDGNGTNQTYLYNALQFGAMSGVTYTMRPKVESCEFKNAYGTALQFGTVKDFSSIGNKFHDITGAAGNPGEGIGTDLSIGGVSHGNTFYNLDDHGYYLYNGSSDLAIGPDRFYNCKGYMVNIYGSVLNAALIGLNGDNCRGGVIISNQSTNVPYGITMDGYTIKNCIDQVSAGAGHGIQVGFDVPGTTTSVAIGPGTIINTGQGVGNSHGIVISYARGVTINGAKITGSSRAGIEVMGSNDISITGVQTSNNDQSGSGYAGINIETQSATPSTNITVTGSHSWDDQSVKTQDYGFLADGNVDKLVLIGNNAHNNTVSNYNISGTATNVKVRDNIGYVSENSGTSAAIASTGTIAHGLAAAPAYVSVVPMDTGLSNIYATADATNITVTYTGGGTHTFYWRASIANSK